MIKDVKVHVVQLHSLKCFFFDDKVIFQLPKSSKKDFAPLSVYSNMSSKTRFFCYQIFSGCYCENHLEHLKEVMLYGSSLIDLF